MKTFQRVVAWASVVDSNTKTVSSVLCNIVLEDSGSGGGVAQDGAAEMQAK